MHTITLHEALYAAALVLGELYVIFVFTGGQRRAIRWWRQHRAAAAKNHARPAPPATLPCGDPCPTRAQVALIVELHPAGDPKRLVSRLIGKGTVGELGEFLLFANRTTVSLAHEQAGQLAAQGDRLAFQVGQSKAELMSADRILVRNCFHRLAEPAAPAEREPA